ncbi:cytochrome c-type biogenesis protein [Moritella sp. F3]|uniref:cytochrome c-type biogenesis protein CcmH n=1 Tax=Moritella sp. F3 TaxID=2718882 RepID=UPI0018E1CC3F|nr:cytochrome c-type biogenesis protein [Moritella sp. F3]GIC78701.1 cytochrome c biogenesis protein [Moritella sp. F1]GIC81371.1 cytochrome c biogenesis protein [Moritella sp. F3]
MKLLSLYFCFITLFFALPLSAESTPLVDVFEFNSIDTQKRAINLARQLRCPQCQNQNLMESNSPIAKDLRLTVYLMVDKGDTDAQVIDYMTNRFGDMVLYKPKFEPRTYVLWLGPVFFISLFGWLGYRKVKASIVD